MNKTGGKSRCVVHTSQLTRVVSKMDYWFPTVTGNETFGRYFFKFIFFYCRAIATILTILMLLRVLTLLTKLRVYTKCIKNNVKKRKDVNI